jgi:hypothetical protein
MCTGMTASNFIVTVGRSGLAPLSGALTSSLGGA